MVCIPLRCHRSEGNVKVTEKSSYSCASAWPTSTDTLCGSWEETSHAYVLSCVSEIFLAQRNLAFIGSRCDVSERPPALRRPVAVPARACYPRFQNDSNRLDSGCLTISPLHTGIANYDRKMPFNTEDTQVYRQDVDTKGNTMSLEERRQLLERYLPDPKQLQRKSQGSKSPSRGTSQKRRVRPYLKDKLHFLLYWLTQFLFGFYLRIRQIHSALFQKYIAIRHHHHRTPAYIQKDLKTLNRLPEHLSVILKYDDTTDDGLETLLDEVAELSAWSAAAGIPLLSVYEKTGVLKQYMSALQELVQQKLVLYFGTPPSTPTLRLFAPNLPSLLPSSLSESSSNGNGQVNGDQHQDTNISLSLLLLSESDGRNTLVDLTRTLAEMAQAHKLRPKDINIDLVDAEISASTSIPAQPSEQAKAVNGHSKVNGALHKDESSALSPEPDLLIVFAPYIRLDGYPPWQIRLTEIFCVGDSGGDVSGRGRTRVEYQGFLRALWNFAGAEFRFGT